MKKIIILLLFAFLLVPGTVYANGAGLPTFFKINDKFTNPNPLQLYGITSQSFLLPQDIAPENYIVNTPIQFDIDTSQLLLVIPKPLLDNTKFEWDFGDGSKAEGLTNTHTYTHIGSYILVLIINVYTEPTEQQTQFIDSYLLNILPNKDYKGLPQAIIKVNGNKVEQAQYNRTELDFSKTISFDAGSSTPQSSIVQYLWNFGDGQTSTQEKVQHQFNGRNYSVAVLRVKDKDGFISDAFVGLDNNLPDLKQEIQGNTERSKNIGTLIEFFSGFLVVTLIIVIYWFLRKHFASSA